MRCRNCHTVMMETDPECPACHSSAERATAPAPGPIGQPSNMLKLLPMFGGALGGLVYAGLASSQANVPSTAAHRTSASYGSSPIKRLFGLLLLLGGGLFLVLAFVHFCNTWKIARRTPKTVTAAELCRKDYTDTAPAWIAYTFAESKPLDVTVTRRRLGGGGDVPARCLLVSAENKWLLATVAQGFEGNILVGRLVPLDPASSQHLIEQLRKLEPAPSALLPYEFNAVDGSASDQRQRFTAVAVIAIIGLAGLWLGVYLLRGRRRPA
jgi:hypothetical protein